MNKFWIDILYTLHIIETCPNCMSAWSGGSPNPEELTHCIVCGDKQGRITGLVWGKLVDPFGWLGRRNVKRNLKNYERDRK